MTNSNPKKYNILSSMNFEQAALPWIGWKFTHLCAQKLSQKIFFTKLMDKTSWFYLNSPSITEFLLK